MLSALIALIVLALVALLILPRYLGFRAQSPAQYATLGPKFDARRHLNGPILCEGVIFGPLGRVTSRFVAQMHGTWHENQCRLTERFLYDSGVEQNRAWDLTLGADGALNAAADDLVGAGLGRVEGNAVQMRYKIRLPAASGGHVLNVVDWMYLMPNGTIMNRSQFRKFGIKVAELVATMRPADPMVAAPVTAP
jgi:hypothetical protein